MWGWASRLKRMRSIASASVAGPTGERGLDPIRSWSTLIAVVSPSSTSTSGRASVGMKRCTNVMYVSLIRRCDSAAIVPNTSELLPEPETPVNAVSRRFGSSTLTSFRLFTRAPVTRTRSWLSASPAAAAGARFLVACFAGARFLADGMRSADLVDADQVAGGVPHRAVPHAVGLVGRLLHDLDVARLQLLEGGIEIGRRQREHRERSLRHHLADRAALVVGDAGVRARW